MTTHYSVLCNMVWDQDFAKSVDFESSERFGINPLSLMENAGAKVFEHIKLNYKNHQVICFIGAGNNGGDGVVASRLLRESGFDVRMIASFESAEKKLSKSLQIIF